MSVWAWAAVRARGASIAWVYGLALVALAAVLVSLFGNVLASLSAGADLGAFTLDNYARLFGDRKLAEVAGRTLVLGAGTVLVMLVFGVPIAWLVARTDFGWKGALVGLLTAKLAIPGFITAMAYVWLFNPSSGMVNQMFGATGLGATPVANVYGLHWICFLQGVVLVPACVFMLLPAFQNMDAMLEEAAWVSGVSRGRAARRIVLPLLAPGVLAAMLFFFVVAIDVFDFVGIIGMPGRIEVLSLWIYDATHPVIGVPDYGFAAATGMLMFVLSAAAIVLYVRFLRESQRYAVLRGKARHAGPLRLGRWRWAAQALVALWLLLAFVIPVLTLVWVSLVPFLQPPSSRAIATLSAKSYGFALSYLRTPLANTLMVMAGAVALVVAMSASISWIVTRGGSAFARWADALVFLSVAVPAMVAAVAFQTAGMAVHRWIPLYGSIWLMAIVMGTRMLTFGTRTVNAAALQIHVELDEAAYASGVSRMVTFRRVFLPIVAPALFYVALMVSMLSARELTLPLMMNSGESPLVSTLIFDLQSNGNFAGAAAVSLYMIVILLALVFGARRLAGIGADGVTAAADPRPRRNLRILDRVLYPKGT
jgi:iron(III) transport system permease protein